MKKIFYLSVLSGLLVFTTVKAADIVAPSKDNPNVNIGSSQTYKNLYTAGSNVSINGNTDGDLVAGGGMVTVDGNVQQEALLAGGTLNLNGSVGNNARLVGGNVTVSGPVGGDLAIAGGNVSIGGKSSVSGDLLAAVGNLTVDGPVNGTARVMGGSITINSKISGDVYVQSSQLTFGPQAEVTGTVHYKGQKQAVVQSGAKVGNIQYTPYQKSERKAVGILTVAFLVQLLAWLIAAFALLGLLRGNLLRLSEETFRRPWVNLGLGIIGLIVVPIVIILLFMTVVGYYAALILLLAYVLWLAVSAILAAVALGYLILRWLSKPLERMASWQAILIGVVIWQLLRFIPIVGWIIMAILLLMVLGELMRMGWGLLKR